VSPWTDLVDQISGFVWGPWLLIPLLLTTGLVLTIALRGLQFRKLWHALYLGLVVRTEHGADGDISHFQALMTALAATVGTGNIVGVAGAIALGGPGALFWMWITGLVGMATKYSEALLSVRFRTTDHRGEQAGGPMYYLANGVAWRALGRVLGGSFALFAAVAAFGIGNMGIRSIGRFTGFFVPVMIVVYMLGGSIVLIRNAAQIPDALRLVFSDAFSGTAAAGGFAGAAFAQTVRWGVARGIFSNESGLGSAGIAAAAAQTREPVRQAMVSMTQTFIDTIVVCSFTGLAILTTGAWQSGLNGAPLTQEAFRLGLPGQWGDWVVALSLSAFAFSTILGWSYYGEKSIEYLFGEGLIVPYRVLFVAAAFIGTVRSLDFVWGVSDVMNGLMAIPNLVGLLLLLGVILRTTKEYFENRT
jgi:AGCS family alanine or glycine:cation symporter